MTPVEPRLVRKLLPPLTSLISTTPAFSLLYECIQTVIVGGMLSSPTPEAASLATTCIEKLSSFLSDSDQNLRYIALKGLSALLGTGHAHLLAAHYDEILSCIEEEDLTIRLKALELVERLTERATCKEVVTRLLHQVAPSTISADGRRTTEPSSRTGGQSAASALRAVSSKYDKSSVSGLASTAGEPTASSGASNAAALAGYRYRLLLLILRLTSRSSGDGSHLYVNISNFEWYIDTLVTVAYLSLSVRPPSGPSADKPVALGDTVAECLLDVTARAPAVQETTVKRMQRLLADEGFADRANSPGLAGDNAAQPVLVAAAFIVSEYGTASAAEPLELLDTLFKRREPCAGAASSQLLMSGLKLLAKWLQTTAQNWQESRISSVRELLAKTIGNLRIIPGAEAAQYTQLIQLVEAGLDGARLAKAQHREDQPSTPALVDEQNADDPDYNPFSDSTSVQAVKDAPLGGNAVEQGPPAVLTLLHGLFFAYELKPLAPGAQSHVTPPDGLDLHAWVGEPIRADEPSLQAFLYGDTPTSSTQAGELDEYGRPKTKPVSQPVYEEKKSKKRSKRRQVEEDDVDAIPIVKLDLGPGEAGSSSSPSSCAVGPASNAKKGKSKATTSTAQPDAKVARPRTPSPPPLVLSAGGDMPIPSKRSEPPTLAAGSPKSASIAGASGAEVSRSNVEGADVSTSEIIPEQAAVKIVKVKKKSKSAVDDSEGKVKKKKKKDKVAANDS